MESNFPSLGKIEEVPNQDAENPPPDRQILVFGFHARTDAKMGLLLGRPRPNSLKFIVPKNKETGQPEPAWKSLAFFGFDTTEARELALRTGFKLGRKIYNTVIPEARPDKPKRRPRRIQEDEDEE